MDGPSTIAHCTNAGCTGTYKPFSKRKTTLCKPCAARLYARDEGRNMRLAAAMRAKHAEPEYRARRAEMHKRIGAKNAANPEWVAHHTAHMRTVGLKHGGSVAGAPDRLKASRSLTERSLGHIPLEYRDTYRALQAKNYKPREITRMVLDMVKADQRKFAGTGRLPQQEREQKG